MKRTAFTLLELLLVLAIIATICGLGITSYQRQYARAQFKSGVVQIQVDLYKTRLLAMQSGEAYLFRYVPGTSVYEIAPLKTLQEVLYRIHGEAEDSNDDSLGGSLAFDNSQIFSSMTEYSDDLFSMENIKADQAAGNRDLQDARQISSDVPSLGGSLTTIQSENFNGMSTTNWGSLNSDNNVSAGNVPGNGGAFSIESLQDASAVSINFRELNAQEKSLAKENSLAWRVNRDGVIVRKQATGDVVFTILRISQSTPLNLRTQRPKASLSDNSANSLNGTDLVETKQALGGSLTGIPEASENDEGLGGGLNELPGEEGLIGELGTISEEEQTVSLWSEPIVFYPNGKTSSAVLGLESVGDYPYYSEIAIRGMTGVARISSISAVPPGAAPSSSVLTREQLFRLSNPVKQTNESSTTGLATSGSSGALGNSISAGATTELSSSIDDLNDLKTPSNVGLSDEQVPGVNYGTGRRTGYNFGGNNSSSSNEVPLGVSLDQGVSSTLNTSTDMLNSGMLNENASANSQLETTDENSKLNGGAL